MRRIIALTAIGTMLGGCTFGNTDSTPPPPQAKCENSKLGSFVGQKASAELGARMLAASGARVLRWGPPGSAMTMDFREDRLTVAYDEAMTILTASCG